MKAIDVLEDLAARLLEIEQNHVAGTLEAKISVNGAGVRQYIVAFHESFVRLSEDNSAATAKSARPAVKLSVERLDN